MASNQEIRKYVRKSYFFIIPMILFYVVLIHNYARRSSDVTTRLKQISKYDCLIMGDSQMQTIISEYFTDSTYSFASSGEHYYFTYHKLLILLSFRDRNFKKVILGVSSHNFAPIYNKLFDPNYPQGKSSQERYFYFTDVFNNEFFDWKDLIFDFKFLFKTFKDPDWGGVVKSDLKNPSMEVIEQNFKFHYEENSDNTYCNSNEIYLSRIYYLCLQQGIEVVMVSLPYHEKYRALVNKFYANKLSDNMSQFKNAKYLNFSNDSILAEEMADGTHLNEEGGKKYSIKINQLIND